MNSATRAIWEKLKKKLKKKFKKKNSQNNNEYYFSLWCFIYVYICGLVA